MYSAARNCTERRVDGPAHEVRFGLEICSELMLPLAVPTHCFAKSVRGYPSANPGKLQPQLHFQRHGSPALSLSPPGDANCGKSRDAVPSCSLFDRTGIPDCVRAARAISAAPETISLSGSRSPCPESRLFHRAFALPVAGRLRPEILHLTYASLLGECFLSLVVRIFLLGFPLYRESPLGTAPQTLILRRQVGLPSSGLDSSADT